jgi:uncharacterized protein YegP (UPF0339 family)
MMDPSLLGQSMRKSVVSDDRFTVMPRKRVEVYKAGDGWRWKAKAGNSRIIAASEEGVSKRAYAIAKAQKQFPDRQIFVQDPVDGYLYPLSDS